MLMKHAHEYEAKPRGGLAKRIVAVLASVAMLGGMGYATSAALAEDDQTSSGDTSTLQPANSKSIAKIEGGDGDQYALHLTASGDSSSSTVMTAVPADIVLVLDKSGSMKQASRDTNAKNAANELAKKLLTDANADLPPEQQVQMAVVTFSKEAQTTSNFTTSSDAISRAVSAAPNGGTNWEDALRTANSLSSGRAGVQKHIVFLSDGNPTFRITSYSDASRGGRSIRNTRPRQSARLTMSGGARATPTSGKPTRTARTETSTATAVTMATVTTMRPRWRQPTNVGTQPCTW